MPENELSISFAGVKALKRLGTVSAEELLKTTAQPSALQKGLAASQRRSTEVMVYTINVKYGDIKWNVERRYSQFDALDHWLRELYPNEMADIKLPGRLKIISPTAESTEVQKRQGQLDEYLRKILSISPINRCFLILHFLKLENPKRSPVALVPTKQGILIKKGDFTEELRARHFVLYDHLYYFKEKMDVAPVGIVNLNQTNIDIEEEMTAEEAQEKEYPFYIKVPDKKRAYYLRAESKKSRKEWIGAIRMVTPEGGEGPSPIMSYVPHAVSTEEGDEEHPELEKSLVDAYRKIFNELDQDGSGAISMNELLIALADAGWEFKDDVVKDLMRMVDYDQSGALDVDEFIDLISMLNFLQSSFDVLDADKSGTIERNELPEVLTSAEFAFDSEEQISALFRLCDRDNSGKIEFEEYLHLVFYLKYLTKLFREYDPESTGEVDKKELPSLLDKAGLEVPGEVHERVIDIVDRAKTSSLSFEEIVHYVFEIVWGNIASEIEAQLEKETAKKRALITERVEKRRAALQDLDENRKKRLATVRQKVEQEREQWRAVKMAAISALKEPGVDLLKHGRSGRPKTVKVWVNEAGDRVHWKSKKEFVLIKDIAKVQSGRTTEVFKRAKSSGDKTAVSFSLICRDRTLDFETKTPGECQTLVQHFSTIISKEKAIEMPREDGKKEKGTPDMIVLPKLDESAAAHVKEVFDRFAGSGGLADTSHLVQMLDEYSKGEWVFDHLTVADLAKSAGAANKPLTLEQFSNLIQRIGFWAGVFKKFDKENKNMLETAQVLKDALLEAGYELDDYQIDSILLKVESRAGRGKGPEGLVGLEDFVGCSAFLNYVWNTFKRQAGGGKFVSRGIFRAILPLVGVDASDELVKVVANDLIRNNEDNLTYDQVAELVFLLQYAPKVAVAKVTVAE